MREGKRVRTGNFDFRIVASLLNYGRVGIIVPRHRRSAVERNRLKRQLREIVRRELLTSLSHVRADLAIRAGPGAYSLRFADLRTEILEGSAGVISVIEKLRLSQS